MFQIFKNLKTVKKCIQKLTEFSVEWNLNIQQAKQSDQISNDSINKCLTKNHFCVFSKAREMREKKNELKCEGTMHDLLQYRNEKLFQCERKQNFTDSNSIVIKVKHSFISPNKFYQLLFVASIFFFAALLLKSTTMLIST